MIRSFPSFTAAALVLLASVAARADETFPNVHYDPITVRVLRGKSAQPLVHAHLTLTGGYSRRDLQLAMWREDALTDDKGNARLSNALGNLPFLEVKVAKKHLCLADPHAAAFSVELIRRDGLSASNRCGTATVEDAPGVFTVFVKGKNAKQKGPKGKHGKRKATAQPPAPGADPNASAVAAACPRQRPHIFVIGWKNSVSLPPSCPAH